MKQGEVLVEKPLLVLLIEDSPADAKYFRACLRKASDADRYWLLHVKRLASAVKILKRDRVDAIVLDLCLPDSHGIESIDLIKKIAPTVPIIVLTGSKNPETTDRALYAGAQDFLQKGEIEGEDLSKAIRFSIDRQETVSQVMIKKLEDDLDIIPGLPGKNIFLDRLEHEIANAHRMQSNFAVVLLDLNIKQNIRSDLSNFFLNTSGSRITQVLRENDTVCYFGKNIFGLLLTGLTAPEDASRVSERLLEVLSIPCFYRGHELKIHPNIGISVYPVDAIQKNLLVDFANLALIQSMELGRSNFYFSSQHLNLQALARAEMERELEAAMKEGQFELYYHPHHNTENNEITALQPLLRWKKSEDELLSANKFIEVAEKSHFIVRLNRWVFESACDQAARWEEMGLAVPTLTFNVSKFQFQDDAFAKFATQTIQKYHLPHRLISFQIPEKAILESDQKGKAWLKQLQIFGFRIVIDDFGQSLASIKTLKDFHPDQINIAATYTQHLMDDELEAATLDSIVRACHRFGIKVAAKEVETESQLDRLKVSGCDFAQGFFLDKVLDGRQTEELLSKQPNKNPLYFMY